MELFTLVQDLNFNKVGSDDDWTDRLNRVHTVTLLLLSSMAITAYTFLGDPLQCWNSGQLKTHSKYVNTVCWISNTYWLPLRQPIPQDISHRQDSEINYYQWVALILLVQCICFYFPRLVWRGLRSWCGFDIKKMALTAMKEFEPKKRDLAGITLADHIHDCLDNLKPYRNGITARLINATATFPGLFCFGKRSGYRFFNCYIFAKLLYLLNSGGQLFVIHMFLTRGSGTFFTGMNLINNWMNNHAWQETGKFPRTTLCDFEVRVMGNLQRHTVQCVLPVNMFNEKIYLLLWFWMSFVTIATFISLIKWLLTLHVPHWRESFIREFIVRFIKRQKEEDEKKNVDVTPYSSARARSETKRFLEYLRVDGVFAIKLLQANSNDFITYGVIKHLFIKFRNDRDKKTAPKKAIGNDKAVHRNVNSKPSPFQSA